MRALGDIIPMKTNVILTTFLATNLIAGAADFVAHEWGTFTSVQGADGIQLEWNPLVTTDLPRFVYDRNRPNSQRSHPVQTYVDKSAFTALQRMETPVIYFYSDKEITVDVNVRFPQGIVTEWYPQTTPATNRQTRWKDVTVLANAQDESLLPQDGSKTHYYAARATDAALLQVSSSQQKPEHEKFLFYRGVGSFRAPLTVRMGANEEYLQMQNLGTESLRHLFALHVHGKHARLTRIGDLPARESRNIKLDRAARPLESVQDIASAMRTALTAEGLYSKEAAAMVETWRDSWFGEQGLRVLYVLPREWTDRTLPLSITPKPREITRVMVGRAEMITPNLEWELMKQIVKFSEGDSEAVQRAQALGMGRFADAAVRRMLGPSPSAEFNRAAWNLLETALREPKSSARLVAK
jgi:hypothetical protein